MVSAQSRPNASAPEDGSRTITVHDQSAPETPGDDAVERALSDGTLRLRGGPRSRPRVAWDERVVDNENCGRKKSKICCIYHKPRDFDESSSESSSESESESSESDSDVSDDGRARPRRRNSNCHRHHRPHPPAHRDGADPPGGGSGLPNGDSRDGIAHEIESHHEPNAYEVQPSHSKKGKGLAES